MEERLGISFHPIAGNSPSAFSIRPGLSGKPITLYAPMLRRMVTVSEIPAGEHPGKLVRMLSDDLTAMVPGCKEYTRTLQELYAAIQRKAITAWDVSSEFYTGYLMAVYRWRVVLEEMRRIDRTVSHSRVERFWEWLSESLDAPALALFGPDGSFRNARLLLPCPSVRTMDMERVMLGWSYGASRMFTHLTLLLGGYDTLTLSDTMIDHLLFEGMYELRRSAEADNMSYSMLSRIVE